MSNKRRNRRTAKGIRHGVMGKARAQMKLAANLTEEQDWYLDTPDVRLTRIFTVVLLLHLVAVGGILAFKMVDKASETSAIKISSAHRAPETAVQDSKVTATEVKAVAPPVSPQTEAPAIHAPAAPLRPDPAKGDQYKVQAGDNLTDIASNLGVSAAALRQKNSIISDNELYPGRWLTIPGKNEVQAAPAPTAPAPVVAKEKAAVSAPAPAAQASAPTVGSQYEVKPGDTAWAISRKFNVSYNQLMKVNGIANAATLQIGQKLRIPKSN